MTFSRITTAFLLSLLSFSAVCLCRSNAAAADSRPNIVLIFTDDQGVGDVGCYGSEIPTPSIDRIAAEGLKMTNWYSASSICTPSRYGLLTGRNPSRSADSLLGALMFMSDSDKSRGLQPQEATFVSSLKDVGYQTALIGKWHLGHGSEEFLPVHHGFQLFKGHTGGCIDYFTMTYGIIPDWYENTRHVSKVGYATELITDEAVAYLQRNAESESPFFLYLAYNAPHFGKGWSPADQTTVNLMQPQASDLKRTGEISDKIRREFAAMVVSLDDGVGRVMRTLETTGLSNDTLVVFLTDHGGDPVYGGNNEPLRGKKATLFEGGIKVPCLMRWPGKIQTGRVSNAVTSSLDLSPTLCRITGAKLPSGPQDGIDLTEHVLNGSPLPTRTLFWETGKHQELGRGNWTAVRSGDWKYVQEPSGTEYMFNLSVDPNEQHDLSQSNLSQLKTMQVKALAMHRDCRNTTE
ncbi:sulfatase family protein [Neorhodopirellula pilleata]|uniref:Arylsulfatase n=1 Tax=Neorhodopirellula pilleata TaxID=2714738 RepID=A0A5C6A6J0_9BACT|nr:sulfatase-like hydrolase/transferase [Neorhodopirellula pilleata]TWT95592.1 Arylsulfatase [Neorhodopirellula pilleata]